MSDGAIAFLVAKTPSNTTEIKEWKSVGLFASSANIGGMRKSDPLCIDGKELKITALDGFLAYHLMRGGIEDVLTMSVLLDVEMRVLSAIDLNAVYLFYDNHPLINSTPSQDLPQMKHRNTRVYCGLCLHRLSNIPCNCEKHKSLTISGDTIADKMTKRSRGWDHTGDRNWVNYDRISESESVYNGRTLAGDY